MKHLLTLAVLLTILGVNGTSAQTVDTVKKDTIKGKADSTIIKMGPTDNVTIIIRSGESTGYNSSHKDKSPFRFTLLGGIDWGFTNWLDNGSFTTSDPNLELRTNKSSNFTLNIVSGSLNIYKKKFKLNAALGIDWQNYRFKNDITPQANQTTFTYVQSDVELSKNKLMSKYIILPVVFHYQPKSSNRNKGFFVEAGMDFGYLLMGRTKQISDEHGKVKVEDDFNFKPFRYGVLGRIGYDCVSIYGKYYLSDVFAPGQGPELNNISFGISLSGFY
ncbi:PorT family protein [Solitalea sp. MAHUQ-68]|uniref:PorT family protein n=1 Tax=Solitalea agri TaxID=2953739 RepID=A0A9X2F0K4_9SPHI|nr:outer membrane beta-barrel protein [Solitalea agri]MCO4292469.1 PorT family protein [Solitalea agri]